MLNKIVFASANEHKVSEIRELLKDYFNVVSLADIGCTEDIPETGDTFEENARQKAAYVYSNYKLNCFSDDSGLEIDALNGEPGVFSARYSGKRDDKSNIDLVLNKMKDVENRSARFKSVISLVLDGEYYYFEGSVEGNITLNISEGNNFGYDPIFQPVGYDKTFAELSLEQKNNISHRGIAIRKLLEFLETKK